MHGPRNDRDVQARRRDIHPHDDLQIRDSGQPPARAGIPEQGHPPEPLRPPAGRGGQDARGPLLFGRGSQGVRPVPRRHARHADHRADHLPRHREERRSGRSGHAVQRLLLGERTLLREQHQHHRRRYAPDGIPPRADAHAQEIRRGLGNARQAEVRHQRRRLPRGTDGSRLGEGGRTAVRGTDQDQAGQRRSGRCGRSGHGLGTGRLPRRKPERRQGDRAEGDSGRHGPPRRPPRPRAGAA